MAHFFCDTCSQIVEGKLEFVVSEDGSADPEGYSCPTCGDMLNNDEVTIADIAEGKDLCEQCRIRSKDEIYTPFCSAECVSFSHLEA